MMSSLGKFSTGISLNLIALAALGWVGWDAWQRGIIDGLDITPARVAAEPIASGAPRVDINAIVRAHLFGQERRVAKPVERQAPPTRLNLKLVGIISVGKADQGIALIESGRGKQESVRVGQAIGNTDAMLAEVAPDHVLIERNGRLEKLAIKRPELESMPIQSRDGGNEAPGGDDGSANLPTASALEPMEPPQPNREVPTQPELPDSAPPDQAPEGAATADVAPPAGRVTLPF